CGAGVRADMTALERYAQALADEPGGPLEETSSMQFPMYTVAVKDLLEMGEIDPHEVLKEKGLLVEFEEPLGKAVFVSHQWVGNQHPDPEFKQMRVLQEALKRMTSDLSHISLDLNTEAMVPGAKPLDTRELRENAIFVWYDYFSCPQLDHQTRRALTKGLAHELNSELGNAIESIPAYIARRVRVRAVQPSRRIQAPRGGTEDSALCAPLLASLFVAVAGFLLCSDADLRSIIRLARLYDLHLDTHLAWAVADVSLQDGPKAEDNPKPNLAFPSYASVSLPKRQQDAPVLVVDADDTMVPSVQNAVNHARKAELRVSKLRKSIKVCQDKWDLFESQAKENFRRERLKFMQEQKKREKELAEAVDAQDIAREAIRQALARDQNMEAAAASDLPSVDSVFEDWAREDDATFQQVLHRAVASAPARTPQRSTGVMPMSPPPRLSTTPGPVSSAPGVTQDPYHEATSIAAAPPGLDMSAHPGMSPVVLGQNPKPPLHVRQDVKTACASGILWLASVLLCLYPGGIATLCLMMCAGRAHGRRANWALAGLGCVCCIHECGVLAVQVHMPGNVLSPGPEVTGGRDTPVSALSRPVATPCRAHFRAAAPSNIGAVPCEVFNLADDSSSEGEEDTFPLDSLHTLLDCSVHDPACQAFYLTATLVETLFEHFYGHPGVLGGPVPQQNAHDAVALQLDSLLPVSVSHTAAPEGHTASEAEVYCLEDRQCLLPCSMDQLHELLKPVCFCNLLGPPGDVPRPGRFSRWLDAGFVGRSPEPEEVLVLTSDGSFSAASGAAGWAVTLSLVPPESLRLPGTFIGCFFGPLAGVASPDGVGPHPPFDGPFDAYLAEVGGLMQAALAVLRLPFRGQVVFRADGISALQGAAGKGSFRDHPLCVVARNLFLALQGLGRCTPTFQHVPGHAGDFANELSDGLAGLGATGRSSLFPFGADLDAIFRDKGHASYWIPHLCISRSRGSELPAVHKDRLAWDMDSPMRTLPAADVLHPFLRSQPAATSHCLPDPHVVEVALISYNVLSLLGVSQHDNRPGLQGAIGRVSLLAHSLESKNIHLAGLQECRTPRGRSRCRQYTRLASGCDDGFCFGVELWISDGGPFRASEAVVMHSDPTVLLVGLRFRGSSVRVLVGHAPHRAHPEPVRQAWWQRVGSLCREFAGNAAWILLMDGNCRFGSATSPSVGSCNADPEDFSGNWCHALLQELDAWIPATFDSCQQGHGGTLCLHRNGSFVRSDYVCIPSTWQGTCAAWVDPGITTGHSCVDHLATVVRISLTLQARPPRAASHVRIDASAIAQPHNAEEVRRIIASAPRPPWHVDVSEHAAAIVDHLYQGLAAAFPMRRSRLREQYFSEATSDLHSAVGTLRHNIRTRKVALRYALLRCAFQAWNSADLTFAELYCGRWLRQLRHRLALSCMLLHRAGRDLRRQCRLDRSAFFSEVASDIASRPPGELHHAVKRVLKPKRFRRGSADPLPLLYKEDGTVCRSYDEVQQAWRHHFSTLEDGETVPASGLVSSCWRWHDGFSGTDTIDLAQAPTPLSLEQAFRHTAAGKACGPDLIPPSLCHHFSSDMSLLFWPMALKTILRATEAVGLKGGLLHHIPKPTAALHNRCSGHRGILVQSCIAKALHRSMRALAVEQWIPHALPMQLGGRRGCAASFGHFCSRAFLSDTRSSGFSAGILFVDLAAAYYSVMRETVLGSGLGDRSVESIAASLHLTRDDLQLLSSHIAQHPVLLEQQARPLFLELARELHSHTWFVMAGDTAIVRTHRGTRPGGALADIVFNILFGRVLQRRDQADLAGTSPSIPWDGRYMPFEPCGQAAPALSTQDVVFADDLASFIVSPLADGMRQAVSNVAAATLNVLPPHGLTANFGPTKTAAVLSVVGKGSRAARRELFSTKNGRLPVWPEHAGPVLLDLVTSYKHLGSILTCDGSLLMEVKHRIAVGRSAFREGRQRLFACKAVPLDRRATLFRSHVLSAILAGSGTWPLLNPREWAAFSGGIVGLFRQLLGLREENWRVTELQIVARTGLPGPVSLISAERLRFLALLVRSGPDLAWALLRRFGPYLAALRQASTWLLQATHGLSPLGPIDDDWHSWHCMMRDSPGRFKGLIKRAEAWHCETARTSAAVESCARSVWPSAHVERRAELSTYTHACLQCKIAFRTRQSWGAHAHRRHSYHHPAHDIAQGRRCQACGLLVANVNKLRLHLKHTPLCLQRLLDPGDALLFPTELSQAHAQAPAEPGTGPKFFGPLLPETSPELLRTLREATLCTDQDIFDVVATHIAPLPVLRNTLLVWQASISDDELSEACADVLLVLHPEHVCDSTAGCATTACEPHRAFSPAIIPSIWRPCQGVLPVVWGGRFQVGWARRWGLLDLPPAEIGLPAGSAFCLPPASGYCFLFPTPPAGGHRILDPAPCPVRGMRLFRLWIEDVCNLVAQAAQHALRGVPVWIGFSYSFQALRPLSEWLVALGGGSQAPEHCCFTCEFDFLQ
ncbi:unnamed protein product, partial [Symbiodinium sp. CCMP2456]